MSSALVLAPVVVAAAFVVAVSPVAGPAPGVAAAPAPVVVPVAGVAAQGRARAVVAGVIRFGWPLRPRPAVLRRFAVGPQPWSPGHRGVDLAAAPGAAVFAAADGTVSFAGPVAGVGVVVVDHGALRTTYEPVTATVARGSLVAAGQQVGTLDPATGHCGVTCLHWGALRGTVYVDPLLLPGLAGPPVLLPLGRAG